MDFEFEWDLEKAGRNIDKHGIAFEEAATLFAIDPNSITLLDPRGDFGEERYIEIGFSDRGRLLVVVYTERNECIRIISARRPTPQEARHYDQG
ncbi:BrnT family toxin [filamentous cyanobacterium LEGE 11480]|uniref:BrnT family toxin n=1 Tax=Romeriopsis navalis LEGE 11480 TaxID=2777977 RepID=A0A928Z666_9CYAN|nr:BrnT family toxin [Romeriopsis navalis]MBE9031955.1 BrnT family toxin [Romeriopsis navalis LEGE 11480]